MTAAGFENAPITRALIILVALLTVTIGSVEDLSLDLNSILRGQVWRLFTSHFAFENMAQTVVGVITLYSSRHFERQLGVKKYAAFVVISYVLSLLLQIALVVVLKSMGVNSFHPSQGPYFIIFALLSMFYSHVPKLQSRALLFGLEFSEKSWIYLLACQLLLANGSSSIGSSVIGLLIGYLYDRNVLGLQRVRLPSSLERSMTAANTFLASIFPRPAERVPTRPAPIASARPALNPGSFGHDQIYGNAAGSWEEMSNDMNHEMMQYGGFGPQPVPTPPPSEESIQMLVGLGFDRQTVLQALNDTGNNVEAAANQLLR